MRESPFNRVAPRSAVSRAAADQLRARDRDGVDGHGAARRPDRRAPAPDAALEGAGAGLGEVAAKTAGGGGGGGGDGVAEAGGGLGGGAGPSAPGTTAAIAINPTSNAAGTLGMAVP
jgi:hypothetical protein